MMITRKMMIVLFFIGMEAATMADMPAPIDIPNGPPNVEAPGGKALPPLAGAPAADAPAISMVSDVTFPDETLVIAGDRLDGATLRVWAEGGVMELKPLRTANNKMQAVVPKDVPLSTMLVWPVKGEKVGAPIRVNGATAWWAWPARLTVEQTGEPQTVRIMGKNLKLGDIPPRMHLQGEGVAQWLTIKSANPYCLDADLPTGLKPGKYEVRAHNGTGGPYGWSEPATFDVVNAPSQKGLKTFRVDDFGAKPDDGQDDAAAIQSAVDAAAKAGGGVVAFSAGTYHVGKPIVTPQEAGAGIHFFGAGMGEYDPAEQAVGGKSTVIRVVEGAPTPDCLIHLNSRGCAMRDMTLMRGHPGVLRAIHERNPVRIQAVRVTQHDATIERVRFVMPDVRPDAPPEKREDLQIYDAALHILAPGAANILVRGCEFHSAGSGIEIGGIQRGHTDDGFPDPSTDYVRIEKCVFRGYSRGFYKEPASPQAHAHMGIFNSGILVPDSKYSIIEGCDFAGADRRGGNMINRSVCVYNTSVRDLYIADNNSRDVGMTCPRQDRIANQGEQIIFHFRYPHGGHFDVLEAGAQSVVVNPDDPRNKAPLKSPHHVADRAGSRVLEEVGTNEHWIVFIGGGKGVGQYRVITGADRAPGRVVLKLDRPWRVMPDATSRVTLTTANRQNIIYNNTIDAGFIDPRSKVVGVIFWYNAMDNVIAGCTLRNVGYGVGFNASFRNPCCWNLVRDNAAEHVGGMAVECIAPACFMQTCDATGGPAGPLFSAGSDVHGWYAVGNVFRSNTGADAPVAVIAHAAMREDGAKKLPPQDDGGLVMPVIENSRFSAVEKGIIINPGACWAVIRNNVVKTTDPNGPAVYDQSEGKTANALILGEAK
ncbi:MAG: glycosyl hydrolase family 28-related protein [Planctomycetota bacterium]